MSCPHVENNFNSQPEVQPTPENSSGEVSFSLVSRPDQETLKRVQERWEELLDSSDNLNLLYQSPQWFRHLLAVPPNDKKPALLMAHDNSGSLAGMVPLLVGRYLLKFEVSAYPVWKSSLKTAFILGSLPLVPLRTSVYRRLFQAIGDQLEDCEAIYLDSVPTHTPLWQYLEGTVPGEGSWLRYVLDEVRTYYYITLPTSFEQYLSRFKRKKRYNFKRQVQVLRKHGEGRLELVRVESENQVPLFLEEAVVVGRNSWQQRRIGTRIDNSRPYREKLEDVARRGLLRSYLLKCGDRPCAFVLGYQFRDVYHYVEIAYDQSLARFSPGTVLLYLLVEDLINHNPPKRLNFGIGYARYKQEFGNMEYRDASVLLLRKNLSNRALAKSHTAFRSLVRVLKTWMQKEQ